MDVTNNGDKASSLIEKTQQQEIHISYLLSSYFDKILPEIKKYHGLIWGGSSLNIYNDCIEIQRQIIFMKECFKNINKI